MTSINGIVADKTKPLKFDHSIEFVDDLAFLKVKVYDGTLINRLTVAFIAVNPEMQFSEIDLNS
jgi:hypothetical protein